MDTSEQLHKALKSSSLTDRELAAKLGYSRPYLNRVRNGEAPMTPRFISKALSVFPLMASRTATVTRKTGETDISLELNIDGNGKWDIDTGIYMFDHLLSQVIKHGRFDLKLKATGDDQHHLIEDVAICLGQALSRALGEKTGIVRMADAFVPMDDALALVAVDLSGRAYSVLEMPFSGNDMAGFPTDLVRHFLETFAVEARLNLHAHILYGSNDHHKAEALFKALGRALDAATRIDERTAGELPSTKGMLEGAKE